MANRYNRDHDYRYQDNRSRHLPRHDDNIPTIRLLTEGAESIIEHSRRYHQQHQSDELSHFPFDEERNARKSSFIGIFPLLRNICLFGSVAVVLMLVSLGEFGLFYSLAMPGLHSNNVLHFDYTGRGIANELLRQNPPDATGATTGRSTGRTTTNNMIHDGEADDYNDGSCSRDTNTTQQIPRPPSFPRHISSLHPLQNEEVHEKYQAVLQSAPVAVVDLFSNHNSWQHYHPDIVPQPKREKRVLKRGAPHYIEIALDLPESNTNREKIGIFSVVVDLQSSSFGISSKTKKKIYDDTATTKTRTRTATTATMGRKLLASSTRTTRMPHESFWISVVRKVICIIPHVLGAIPESRRVVVPSYRFFVESDEFPLRYVTVRLLVSPEKAQKGDLVEVVQGMLRIGEELTGMQLVLKEWFFTCTTIGTLVFFFLQLVIVLVIRVWWKQRRQRQQERVILEDDVSESLGLNGLDGGGGGGGDVDSDDVYGADDHNGNNNSERRSSRGQQQNNGSGENFDDEEGEWEDLPQQPTMETDSQRTTQNNETQACDRETPEVNSEPDTLSSPPTPQPEDESQQHHLIPDN